MGTQNRRFPRVSTIDDFEDYRAEEQRSIDTSKSTEERRRFGQFATPNELAKDIIRDGLALLGSSSAISFLEPAAGTGSFLSALIAEAPESVESAIAFEIDSKYGSVAKELWGEFVDIRISDFTRADTASRHVNFLVTNPPYVRHHYINRQEKERLKELVFAETGFQLSGLAGYYCYFLMLAHKWLAPGAICGWLIPSEFMDVNYGYEIKRYLLETVHLLRIHRFNPNDLVFSDALVSSAIVWYKNETIKDDYDVDFSYGGRSNAPAISGSVSKKALMEEKKWTRFPIKEVRPIGRVGDERIKDYFDIKRGLATGNNSFFIVSMEEVIRRNLKMVYLQPILPSPRFLKTDKIEADGEGIPTSCEQLFLINCDLEPMAIKTLYPELWEYLETGINNVASGYLCRSRKHWYLQERRAMAPLLCTYMGRNTLMTNSPFSFILNQSRAIATNSYLMLYPKSEISRELEKNPTLLYKVWDYLRTIKADTLESEGRVYGGGLKKIEPKELGEVKCFGLGNIIFGENYRP